MLRSEGLHSYNEEVAQYYERLRSGRISSVNIFSDDECDSLAVQLIMHINNIVDDEDAKANSATPLVGDIDNCTLDHS